MLDYMSGLRTERNRRAETNAYNTPKPEFDQETATYPHNGLHHPSEIL